MFHPESKIYFDGSHYIAIPKTEGKKRRVRPPEEKVVFIENKIEVKEPQPEEEDVFADLIPVYEDVVVESKEDVNIREKEKPKTEGKRTATRSEIFNELYEEALELPKKKRRKHLINGMLPYFKRRIDCEDFVTEKLENKIKAIIARKTRFIRKAYMNNFNYFVTFTYDDNLHTEESFKKRLSKCLANYQKRRGWKYMGVWERAPNTKRLHFHGLFIIPENSIPGEMEEVKDYSFNTHKMEITHQNTFFKERFGRNDFDKLNDDIRSLGNAMMYILKYIEKSHDKIVYSRGLPMYYISDISDEDVLMSFGYEDNKFILCDDFMCYDEGVEIGKISQETMRQLRTSN